MARNIRSRKRVSIMQEIRNAHVNNREIPVLISNEKEALLAAHAAGRAVVGYLSPGIDIEELASAPYLVEELSDVSEEFLDRVARRHLGLPWRICETERLVIREMIGDDYDEAWENQVGGSFNSVEEFLSYTRHQYTFYEFGFWALVEKATGELAGVAGLTVPGEPEKGLCVFEKLWDDTEERRSGGQRDELTLELGYHIFSGFRRKGFGRESCLAILEYGAGELGVTRFIVRIREGNRASEALAQSLGFRPVPAGNHRVKGLAGTTARSMEEKPLVKTMGYPVY